MAKKDDFAEERVAVTTEAKQDDPIPAETDSEKRLIWLRDFLQKLSHDLSGPLTPLSGHLDLMASGGQAAFSPLQKRCFAALQKSAARLRRFNDGVLEVARLERGAYPLELKEIALDGLLTEVFEKWRPMFDEAQLRLQYLPARARTQTVISDARLMRQMIDHLLENAVAFCPPHSNVTLYVRADDAVGEYTVGVEDDGPGVEDGRLEEIFGSFVRLGRAEQREGPGLGLTAVALASRLLGGRVVAANRRVDDGSKTGLRVEITLPSSPAKACPDSA